MWLVSFQIEIILPSRYQKLVRIISLAAFLVLDNAIASYMSAVEKEFVEFVNDEKLAIKRIVGHHRNGNISPEVMHRYDQENN